MLSEKPWRSEIVVFLIGVVLLCWNLAFIVVATLHHFKVPGFEQADGVGNVVLMTLSFHGITLLFIPVFLRFHDMSLRELYCRSHVAKSVFLAISAVVVVLPVALLLEVILVAFLKKMGWQVEDEAAVKLVTDAKTIWMQVYLGVFTMILAPVAEEFLFRGVLFRFAKQRGHRYFAWFGISVLFAAIHLDVARFLPLFVLALVLTWLYERTGNLLAPTLTHSLFNTFGFVMIMFGDRLNHVIQKTGPALLPWMNV